MSIVLMIIPSADWGTIKVILVCSVGGVLMFYGSYVLLILLLKIFGIDVVDKQKYDEWKKQRLQVKTPKVFSYALYGWILTLAALACGASFTDYHQALGGIIFELIMFSAMGFLGAQIIMRIIFLTCNITTDKGDIEAIAHEIEKRRAEKKELKKLRKEERREKTIWLRRAFYRGLGFGAGWSIFNSGGDNNNP